MSDKLTVTAEPNSHAIHITNEFDAPVDKVFRAYTDRDAIVKWFGGKTYETKVDKYDARPGGEWRMVQKGPDGNDYGFHGVFHEVAQNERVTWTFEFEGLPEKGHVALETVYFTEENGKTKLRIVSVYQSVEDRDGMVQSGMEKGLREGMDVLREMVESSP
jgi:uncharacterized protein YndB with AHSA1/START domain